MSNLGAYQTMTTLAKKFGGPVKLGLAIAVGGYAVIRTGESVLVELIGNENNPYFVSADFLSSISEFE